MRLTTFCTLITPLFFALHIGLLNMENISLDIHFLAALGAIPAAIAVWPMLRDISHARSFFLAAFAVASAAFSLATLSLALLHSTYVISSLTAAWTSNSTTPLMAGTAFAIASTTVLYLRKTDV